MRSMTADGDTRLLFWQDVREFAVPATMIETAATRRAVGDWAGACAAARVDVALDLRAVNRAHGGETAARLRDDLRHLAPDLLRWHMPRVAPDGVLRPGLTLSLARYGPQRTVHLVVRTPPAWAEAGQRISLALWDAARPADGVGAHPHPHPDQRFRLDLHRHLWDARRTGELRERSGLDGPGRLDGPDGLDGPGRLDGPGGLDGPGRLDGPGVMLRDPAGVVPTDAGCALDRWAAEADLLLRADGRDDADRGQRRRTDRRTVAVRLGARHRLLLDLDADTPTVTAVRGRGGTWPVLPDAATWVPPDVELLRHGLIDAERLHPLVAAALAPDDPAARTSRRADDGGARHVDCRGATHRIGLVDGVLVALDHDPAEIRREELLAALGGPPLPCLRVIDQAHRHPECLADVQARLAHGDATGALAAVESLLGPDVLLRAGALRDVLDEAVARTVRHGLYRAGLAGRGPVRSERDRRGRELRGHPRHASTR